MLINQFTIWTETLLELTVGTIVALTLIWPSLSSTQTLATLMMRRCSSIEVIIVTLSLVNLLNQNSLFIALTCSFQWVFLRAHYSIITVWISLGWMRDILVSIVIFKNYLLRLAIGIILHLSIIVLETYLALWNLVLVVSLLVIVTLFVTEGFLACYLITLGKTRLISGAAMLIHGLCIGLHLTAFCTIFLYLL